MYLMGAITFADDGKLFFMQSTAVDKQTYVLSSQIQAMKNSFDMALREFRAQNPHLKCTPSIEWKFDLFNDADFYEEVRKISMRPGRKAIVGLTRTNFARLAARAAVGTDMVGISSGSTSDELRKINPNFISVGSATHKQWEAAAEGLKKLSCTPHNTLGIFSDKDIWSAYYRKSYLGSGYKMLVTIDELLAKPNIDRDVKCIFFGITVPASIKPLSKLLAMEWPGIIIGNYDWTFFSAEIRAVLSEYKSSVSHIYATLNWSPKDTDESQQWVRKYFRNSALVEPIHAGVYDSTIIALNYLCRDQDVLHFNKDLWKSFGTLSEYGGISTSGNLETDIRFVELPLAEWK